MTAFASYLSAAKITDGAFAVLIGKDRSLVNKLRNGKLSPTLEVAAKIEEQTGGAVKMQDWTHLASLVLCSTCERRVEDPVNSTCTRTDCGLRQREAA